MRFFNTAGPVNCQKHYCLSPLSRLNLTEIISLIHQEKYFVLHAPRQTGKTSALLALMEYLNHEGQYTCLYVNVEMAQAARENVFDGIQAILSELASTARTSLGDSYLSTVWREILTQNGHNAALSEVLTRWAEHNPKPIVLLIDEIDSLIGDTLISVLRQIRVGYTKRPNLFPQSIVLCGVRDVRDYRIHSDKDKAIITGGSAFNIKAESLRLGNFSLSDIQQLYQQHTEATGQPFEAEVFPELWRLTEGQPWLVNALGYEVCFKTIAQLNQTTPITRDLILQASETLILRRETHLDQLVDKLREDRVRRIIQPIIAADSEPEGGLPEDDILYVRDLGLISPDKQLRIANAIYQEIIPRSLTYSTQMTITHETAWYVQPTGSLDMVKLLTAFQQFFRQHSEHWLQQFDYREAGPQLLLQAFLQRIVNGGGRVEREYGLGMRRTDLLIIWPIKVGGESLSGNDSPTPYSNYQRIVLELKILYGTLEQTMKEGLPQTWYYMDRCGATEGHLIIFDRTPDKPWTEKIFKKQRTHKGQKIRVWGM